MAKINYVMEGTYKDRMVCNEKDFLTIGGEKISKRTISSYDVIDESNKNNFSFFKGALGVALLGSVGTIAGITNKKEYLVVINWIYPKNMPNNKSLIVIDEKCYKTLVRSMF